MTAIDGLIKHEFNIPGVDDPGPHDHAVNSDYNNGHVLSGGAVDGADVLSWDSGSTSKGKFRTLIGGSGISVSVSATQVTIAATGVPTGSGTSGFVARWTGASTLGNSIIADDGAKVAVNAAVSTRFLALVGGSFTGSGGDVAGLNVSTTVTGPSGNQVYGAWVNAPSLTVTGAPTTNASLRVDAPSNSQAGATNAAAIYVSGEPTGATNNYGILINGAKLIVSASTGAAGNFICSNNAAPAVVGQATAYYGGLFFNVTDAGSDVANANQIGLVGQSVYAQGLYVQQGAVSGTGSTLARNSVYPGAYITRVTASLGGFNFTQPLLRVEETTAATGGLLELKASSTVRMLVTSPGSMTLGITGPHAIGGAVNTGVALYLRGTFASTAAFSRALQVDATLTAASDSGNLVGVYVNPVLTERGAGTHPILAGVYVEPSVSAGAANTSELAGVYVAGLTAASGTTDAAAAILVAPTGATNNYGLLVKTGSVKVVVSGPHAVGTALDGNIQFAISGSYTSTINQVEGLSIRSTLTPNGSFNGFGAVWSPTISSPNGATVPLAVGLYAKSTTALVGTGTITSAYSLYLDAPTGASTTGQSATLFINGVPTIGASNFAAIVNAGTTKLNGLVQITGTTTAPTTGAGIELRGTATPSLTAFNRGTSVYLPLVTDALKQDYTLSGGASLADAGVGYNGSWAGAATHGYGIQSSLSVTIPANGNGQLVRIDGTLVEAGSGTHPILAGLYVKPTVTAGAGNVTEGAGVYIDGSTFQTTTATAASLLIKAAPTGGTVNYAAYIVAGAFKTDNYIQTTAPNTRTDAGNAYTLVATDNYVIVNKAATFTLTLPTASANTGRAIWVQTYTANTVVSAASNVVPKGGGAAATAILPATAGAWALIVSDGTNWVIMSSGT